MPLRANKIEVSSRCSCSISHPKPVVAESGNEMHASFPPREEQESITSLCEKGRVDDALEALFRSKTAPSDTIYLSLLKACNKTKALSQVECVYEHLIRHNVVLSFALGDYLVMMLAKCGSLQNAFEIFWRLPRRSVFSWTALISSYVDSGQGQEALAMYKRMRDDGVCPDNYTFVSLFKACSNMFDLKRGKKLHREAERHGVASDLFVCNTLISMYGKCREVKEAEDVFRGMREHNVVSWSVMLSAYVEKSQPEKALKLYRQMREKGVDPDQRAFLFTFQAIALLAEKEEGTVMHGQVNKVRPFEIGRALHADARVKGLSIDSYVSSALVCMYGKCEALVEAEDAIASLPKRNLIAWNAMLSVYIEHGMAEKALGSYRQMLEECAAVDDVTFLSLLQACGEIGCPEICECIHFDAVSAGFEGILAVAATLIHAYGSGASMEDAESVFDGISEPHIPAWNACIAGYAGKGSCRSSLDMFERLRMSGCEPDEVTFILILSACSHCGLISQGIQYFLSMHGDYGLTPDLRHYGIMANLLGRVGSFGNLESMLGKMRMRANSSIYLCLLGACRTHGNIELAKQVFEEAVKHRPKHAIPYVLMSNVIANAEMEELRI